MNQAEPTGRERRRGFSKTTKAPTPASIDTRSSTQSGKGTANGDAVVLDRRCPGRPREARPHAPSRAPRNRTCGNSHAIAMACALLDVLLAGTTVARCAAADRGRADQNRHRAAVRQGRVGAGEIDAQVPHGTDSDVDETPHREYVQALSAMTAVPSAAPLYKLSVDDPSLASGASALLELDELPQLLNVLRGQMALSVPSGDRLRGRNVSEDYLRSTSSRDSRAGGRSATQRTHL